MVNQPNTWKTISLKWWGIEFKKQQKHFQNLHRLLKLEAEAEKAQLLARLQQNSAEKAEKSGLSLVRLIITDESSTIGGLMILTMRKKGNQPFPWHNLGPGQPILLTAETDETKGKKGEPPAWRGTISRTNRQQIKVAIPRWAETGDSGGTFRLDLAHDEIAQRRQREALDRATEAQNGRLANLRDLMLEVGNVRYDTKSAPKTFLNAALNESQQEAVTHALQTEDFSIIHGPPGTGKTTAVIELIRQAVHRQEKVLATAPSNAAVDNLLERLAHHGVNVVRLGNPIRVPELLWPHTLNGKVANHPNIKLAAKYTQQARELFHKVDRYTRAKPAPGEKRAYRQEAKALLAEARTLEDQAVEQIIDQADVVCSTLTGLSYRRLKERTFTWGIIDEAAQAEEPSTWIPMRWVERVVLAGDHCQLPPTVISTRAQREGLGISLMERLIDLYDDQQISRRLTTQYRMHETIMGFSSTAFYEGSLVAADSVSHHLLTDLPNITADPLTTASLHYIDTAGASYDESAEEDTASRLNPQEADLLVKKLQTLLDLGVPAEMIGIITPYGGQARHLRELIPAEEIEISTVDGFQGREKEVILISLVRSNPDGEIGFLTDTRRINVALTRARRHLLVIGDSATITAHPFYQDLITYFEQTGAYKSVWEELY